MTRRPSLVFFFFVGLDDGIFDVAIALVMRFYAFAFWLVIKLQEIIKREKETWGKWDN